MLHRALRMLFVLTIVGSLFVIVPAAPAAAAGGMTIRADTAYDIQTEAGLVAVTSDITVTNVTPDKRSGYTITQYYYYAFSLPIPPEAENVAATSGGRNLTVDVTDGESDMYKIAEIRLRSRLYYKQSHSIQLTFDFVGQEPRSDDSAVRVNDAFVWFFAWALGDASRATVRITAPPEMDVSIDGSSMRHSVNEEGFDTWFAEDIADPAEWFVTFTGFADDRLAQVDLEVAGNGIEVRYWPGDDEWRDDVVDTVDEALPALAEKLGLDWPVDGDLVIRETVIPNYFGYAGWYFVEDDIIEMGEYTDTEVIVHEVSHAWFNDDLFDSRWIVEGLAQAVTEEILLDDFSERVAPETIDVDDAAFRKLNTWTFLSAGSMDDDVEYVGYNSSWWIVGEILDEIEVEGLQEVLAAALDNEIAYLGAGDIESVDEKDDWKRFLDLVEERGGATSATDLFTEYVVRTAQLTQLESRSVARAAYADLTADFTQWSPPIIVRLPMSDWEFEVAGARIADADAVLDAVTALDAHAAEAGLDRPATIEAAYERVQWSFDGAQHLIADQEATLAAIDDAASVVAADRSEATNLGLTDLDPEAELAAARAAFEANELADARVRAAVAIAMVEAAGERGDALLAAADMQRTVIAGVGGLVLVWLVGLLFMRWRRKKRGLGDEAILGDELPMFGPPTPDLLDGDAVYGPPTPVSAFVGAEAPAPEVPEPPGLG